MCDQAFTFSRWRHGGWYVHEVRYASGAIGCVSNNYEDRKWRIACDPRPFDERPTFKTREEAARAEYALAEANRRALPWIVETNSGAGWAQCGWIRPCATEAEALAAIEHERERRPNEPRALRARNTFHGEAEQ